MSQLLKLVQLTNANVWRKQSEWAQDVDPTILDTAACDYCPGIGCNCSEAALGSTLKLRIFAGNRASIQAVAEGAGQIAFQKGSFLGPVAGEIVQAGSYADRWTYNLDWDGKTVCQIWTAEIGNWSRLLRRIHDSSAVIVTRRRKGRLILAVEALRDIYDGEEVTVAEIA
jgi:hypothetical protein